MSPSGPIYEWAQPHKTIILWEERITWALIWKKHEVWSELPTEIYKLIDGYMQERMGQCFLCKAFACEEGSSNIYCSTICKNIQGYTFFGQSDLNPFPTLSDKYKRLKGE
jgi:hypothetical protein